MRVHCFLLVFFFSSVMVSLVTSFDGWIDPDTREEDKTIRNYFNQLEYELVMSDEFNRDGRTFKDGHDPMWTALDKSDDDQTASGKKSLQYYNSSNIYTKDGHLNIVTNTEDTHFRAFHAYEDKYVTLTRNFKSGMLQGWNKFCFTGGVLEFSAQLPGEASEGGLWPAAWMLGNLGRATYEATTNNMWPFSYERCDREKQRAQLISGCDETEHFSLLKGQGRGATEIDIIEVMPGESGKLPVVTTPVERPYVAMTLQVAPGIPENQKRPQSMTLPEWGFTWYQNLTYGLNVSQNPFFYGNYLGPTKKKEPVRRSKAESYQCDSIGALGGLQEDHFQKMHRYRLEWEPGDGGYLRWYIDGKFKFGIEQSSLSAAMGTQIPQEPSYLIFNTAISTSWGFPEPPPGCDKYDCKTAEGRCGMSEGFCRSLPAVFSIDHVRVYQYKRNSSSSGVNGTAVPSFHHSVGCNPPSFPTRRFIQANEDKYRNAKDTHPLRQVVTGTGKCQGNGQCGEGKCLHGACMCAEGWQGPRCLVPAYRNDFPDWDKEVHWLPPLRTPLLTPLLTRAGLLLLLAFLTALAVVTRARRIGDKRRPLVSASQHDLQRPERSINEDTAGSERCDCDCKNMTKQLCIQNGVGGWRMFVFGGVSAQVAALFTNPIDVVKIRLQLQGEAAAGAEGNAGLGLFSMFRIILREEGLLAFWKGVVPSLLREITYSSIRLGAYEPLRDLLTTQEEQQQGGGALWKKLLAGAAAGAVGSGLATPVDLVKVQQQAVRGSCPNVRNGRTLIMLQQIYQQQGVAGLYRGVVPTVQRASLLTATQLGTYDEIKQALLRGGVFTEGPLLHFCSGTVAGLGVSIVTSPVDTIRTRIMNQPIDPCTGRGALYRSSLHCLTSTVRAEGFFAIYKGFFAQWLRVGPHTTISLVCFESLRHFFGLQAI